jgi:putative flippase GtrA
VTTPPRTGVRYTLIAFAALGADFVLTLVMHQLTPLSLWACAAISFVVIGITFYFIHEHWTFRREQSHSSPARLAKNFLVLCAAFAARVAAIAMLEHIHAPDTLLSIVYFGAGAALSFALNFLANRFWVFQQRQ